jgi:putative transposase
MLVYITGTVDQELLQRNEYLAAENRILRAQIKGRLLLSDAEKATLAEIGHRLGRKALEELAAVAKPDTLLAWYRKLIADKVDGSRFCQRVGRPRIDEEPERLVLQMAIENPSWGYNRVAGALKNRGQQLSHQTVGNILPRMNAAGSPVN